MMSDYEEQQQPISRRVFEVGLIVLMFFAFYGDVPPDVNEAHYLCRLKHFWNPAWCAGDLFLESQDAQVLLVWAFGWVTRLVSLTATAWIGRLVAWTLIAFAWQRLNWRLIPVPLAAVLSAGVFATLNNHAQLAGEWVIGGIEAKCIAYGFVLLALGDVVVRRWNVAWLLLGIASAFHPIVGGWSTILAGGIWLVDDRREVPLRTMLPGLLGGGIVALVGVLPALMLTRGVSPEVAAEASRIYVFERLPHHLALATLPAPELLWRLSVHGALLAALGVLVWVTRSGRARTSEGDAASPAPLLKIAHYAWGAVALAVVGFAIEFALWERPLLAARVLRYYWFRMTDFGAPLAVALLLTALAMRAVKERRRWGALLVSVMLVAVGADLVSSAWARLLNPVPPADVKVRVHSAWLEACDWIRRHTPPDALFLTPRLSHTFKWNAARPEVVNRKDIPQDAASIVEWYARLKDIYYYTGAGGLEHSLDSIGPLGTERVRELGAKYGADYALMDRTQLVDLPRVFWNEEYVVYRIDH